MKLTRKFFLTFLVLAGLTVWWLGTPPHLLAAGDQAPYQMVILSDPHIPGKFLPEEEAMLHTINSWPDVNLVVVTGDVCVNTGTEQEYAAARQFFNQLHKPLIVIPGNHEFIYSDIKTADGKRMKGGAAERQKKLALFQKTFEVPSLYYSKAVGNYRLIFLAPDDLHSDQSTRISQPQLAWLRAELKRYPKNPTIIFFHGPLYGTLSNFNPRANTSNYIAQPQNDLHEILQQNLQVFLWVCGHMHVPATNKDFRSDINYYEHHVYTLHNANMNRKVIWTNSLFLYPDKVVIKTYNHRSGAWMPEMEKTLVPPRL